MEEVKIFEEWIREKGASHVDEGLPEEKIRSDCRIRWVINAWIEKHPKLKITRMTQSESSVLGPDGMVTHITYTVFFEKVLGVPVE